MFEDILLYVSIVGMLGLLYWIGVLGEEIKRLRKIIDEYEKKENEDI